MRVLVTGAAGFVGSNLVDRLLADGHHVVGVDAFTDYYEPAAKRANVAPALEDPAFELVEADLASAPLDPLLDGVEVVFHQAGQPGVRLSWDEGFARYAEANVLATQRLLEAARRSDVSRFVYASSSSVYGNAARYPTTEQDLPRPHSPYGVTKLAAEHLCVLFAANWGLPTVSLRYFTVYGPRQRPDMAIHRLLRASLTGGAFPMFGDGSQVRDFTFVGDVVEANLLAAVADVPPGTVVNVAGGSSIRLGELVDLVGQVTGRAVRVDRRPAAAGDVARTGGTIAAATRLLGWRPAVDLADGVAAQARWQLGVTPAVV